ncbi:MAG: hypothetical protein NWF11_01740 [Candidatus Bathyarchaeota archaeon]|nr:hypothetical protein [Candidatus Bathyarchaeota archaeon]
MNILEDIGLFMISPQSIEIESLKTDGLILDIGGGGEGVIGKLNGKQVVAIDTSERECPPEVLSLSSQDSLDRAREEQNLSMSSWLSVVFRLGDITSFKGDIFFALPFPTIKK